MELDLRDRADDRPVRGVRGRVVQLQGGLRGLHHGEGSEPSRRSCSSSPARCRTSRTTCRSSRRYRNPKLGALAPIAVVNTVFSAGDANRGVQTAAFNLPNDERVIREKGSKRVMLKNNQQAKFDKVLVPISRIALARADQGQRGVRRFLHPHPDARADARPGAARHHASAGRATTVRQELKETYSAIEEAKADISGLFALQFLVDQGTAGQEVRADDVHDVPGLGVPLDPLRDQRGARPRPGDSAQLPAGSGRVPVGRRRHLLRGRGSRSGKASPR